MKRKTLHDQFFGCLIEHERDAGHQDKSSILSFQIVEPVLVIVCFSGLKRLQASRTDGLVGIVCAYRRVLYPTPGAFFSGGGIDTNSQTRYP